MDEWLRDHLVCPQDKKELTADGDVLVCRSDHRYVVVDGIPVMLFDDGNPTHGYITRSIEQAARIGAGERPNDVLPKNGATLDGVDGFVQHEIPYTCGNLYFSVQNRLKRYPFPELRLAEGNGRRLLDVGCNWGRWTIVAEQKGYRCVGIDPSLEAVMAARRISRQIGVSPSFVVADARALPFRKESFDISFSFGVLQHLKKQNARMSLREMARVTMPGGEVVVQMANKYGIRCFYHQVRLGFKDGREGGDSFYWTPAELRETFTEYFGDTEMTVDCYFGLGIQKNDIDLLPTKYKMVVHASEFLRKLSSRFPPLIKVADSLYVRSIIRDH